MVWLKRFRGNPGPGSRKVSTPVGRLDQDLDLTGHLDTAATAAGGVQPTAAHAARYRPRTIVCHHGTTLRGGHYTTWIRAAPTAAEEAQNTWVQYDDSIVGRPQSNLPPSISADAVLLFYEQVRHNGVPPRPPAGPGVVVDLTADPADQSADGDGSPAVTEARREEGGDVAMSDGEDEGTEPRETTEENNDAEPMDTS